MKTKDKDVQTNLNIQALLLPKVDDGTLTGKIAGQSESKAQDILSQLSHVTNVNISISPNLPFLPKNLPKIQRI